MNPEPRALLIKCRREEDFYVAWLESVEATAWYGTAAEALKEGYTQERIDRADEYGTSSIPMIDIAGEIPWEGGRFYGWDSKGMIAEQRGFLPRRHLRAYVLLYDFAYTQAAFDLLEPFEGETEVRRG